MYTTAKSYIYEHLLNNDADNVINIVEDAFVIDNEKLMKLIDYVKDNNYINCGRHHGGVVDIRKHNSLVSNPFFNILDIREIRKKIDLEEINKNYADHKTEFERFTPKHLIKYKYEYDYYEPYNPFFVWLTVNFKTLFLDATVHQDGLTTILKDHLGKPFLFHSWYSRFYGLDSFHTERINNLYIQATGNSLPKIDIINRIIILRDKIGMKYYFNIKNKLLNKFNNK